MAHIEHHKSLNANLAKHIDRVDDEANQKRHYTNNIDKTRTHLNYDLNYMLREDFQGLTTQQRLDKRIEELREGQPKIKILKEGITDYQVRQAKKEPNYKEEDFYNYDYKDFRKDVNKISFFVLTLPTDDNGNDIFKTPEEQKAFFVSSTNYLINKLGKENILNIQIHNDETHGHQHVQFCPAVFDEKKQNWVLSSKRCIDRKFLLNLHSELQLHLEKELGRTDFSILKDRETKLVARTDKEGNFIYDENNNKIYDEIEVSYSTYSANHIEALKFVEERDKREQEKQNQLKEINNLQKQREDENKLLNFSKEQNKKEELKLKNTSKELTDKENQLKETNQQLEIQQKELEKAKFDYADVLEIEKYEHPKTLFGTDKTKIIVPIADIEHQNKISIDNATVAMREKEKALKSYQEASNAKYALRQHMTNYDVQTLSEKVKEQENQIKDLKKDNRNLTKYYNSFQKTLLKLEPSLRDEINKSIKKELSRDGFIIE